MSDASGCCGSSRPCGPVRPMKIAIGRIVTRSIHRYCRSARFPSTCGAAHLSASGHVTRKYTSTQYEAHDNNIKVYKYKIHPQVAVCLREDEGARLRRMPPTPRRSRRPLAPASPPSRSAPGGVGRPLPPRTAPCMRDRPANRDVRGRRAGGRAGGSAGCLVELHDGTELDHRVHHDVFERLERGDERAPARPPADPLRPHAIANDALGAIRPCSRCAAMLTLPGACARA